MAFGPRRVSLLVALVAAIALIVIRIEQDRLFFLDGEITYYAAIALLWSINMGALAIYLAMKGRSPFWAVPLSWFNLVGVLVALLIPFRKVGTGPTT